MLVAKSFRRLAVNGKETGACGGLGGLWVVWVTVFLLASPALAKPASKSARLAGRAFISTEPVKDQAPSALSRQFRNAPAQSSLSRKPDGHWVGTVVAFFKTPSVPGPIIVWVFDKSDKQSIKDGEPVVALNIEGAPRNVMVYKLDFDPDSGFNKERAYLVRIGQLINNKAKIYATGEVKLLK